MVQKKFTAKTTQITAIAMSMGQISSAYSLPCVRPKGSVSAALTMMSCQPQKFSQLRTPDAMRALRRRCVE